MVCALSFVVVKRGSGRKKKKGCLAGGKSVNCPFSVLVEVVMVKALAVRVKSQLD